MKKIKIVEWPHYHEAPSNICQTLGWQEVVRRSMPCFKDEIKVINQFIFIVYKN